MICYYDPLIKGKISCSDTLNFIGSAPTSFSNTYKVTYDCKKLGLLAEDAIKKYANDNNKTLEIGGPIRIIRLNEYGAEWMQNKPTFHWEKMNEFLKDYKLNKVIVKFTSDQGKIRFDQIADEYLNEK